MTTVLDKVPREGRAEAGTANLMALDLAATPISGIYTQIGGDAHCANLGAFATPERNLLFDVRDFDETLRGPWEWDVKRLATSLVLASRDLAPLTKAGSMRAKRSLRTGRFSWPNGERRNVLAGRTKRHRDRR